MATKPRRSSGKAQQAKARGPHDPSEGQATATPKPKRPTRSPAAKPAAQAKPGGAAAFKKPRKPLPGSSSAEHPADNRKEGGSTPPPATTLSQARFIAEYLIDFNGTRAYLAAYPGVRETTARTEASRLLANPNIQAAVAAAAKKTANKLELTRERVFLETARVAFFDPRRLTREDGTPIPLHELDDDAAACITSVDVIGPMMRYRIADKNSSLDRAAKLLALFKEDNEQKGKGAAEAVREFFGHLHAGAGRLPIVKPDAQ